ncbi:hypothetical protein ACFVIM_15955 [Streptomyces sp. NPDC057638]|uniref:hypothetical protein n=1 Tax=Streptomyces sp. NPDC057638 TaxID=3346190 RepID=UPI0036A15ED8
MDQHTPTAAVLAPPDAVALDESLDEMSGLLDRHGSVIVLCSAALPTPHEYRLHTLRAVLESDRIAVIKLDLPPLGIAVLARQLRQLSVCDFGPGVVASAARLLSHYVFCGALLNSVTRLDRVPVDLRSHARSWVPGSQFAVLATPRPELVRAGAGRLTGPTFPTRLIVARGPHSGADRSEWIENALVQEWQPRGMEEVTLPGDSPGWWGTAKMVEFAAFLPDIPVLYQLVSSVRREQCTWCGIELIGDRCGFCSAPLAPLQPAARASGAPARPPGRASGAPAPLTRGTPAR